MIFIYLLIDHRKSKSDFVQNHSIHVLRKNSNVCKITHIIQLEISMIMMIYVIEKIFEFQNDFIIEYVIEYNF